NRTKRQPPQPADRLHALSAPLIQPDYRWAQRLSLAIEVDNRRPLRRDRDAFERGFRDVRLLPELLARLAERGPEILRLLFRPPRLLGVIRLDRHAGFGEDVPFGIDQQRSKALRAVVDRQDDVLGLLRHVSSFL